ncbi:MAG: hydantoinase/oxoprolinase family protein [Alphaproteobacteria bacterium]|nr:hydantoinase/oxoprolinase family protein [Alphaproteobacteria bacterium]
MAKYRLGVDVGGTHTDLVLADAETHEILIEKVHSTPSNPSLAVLDGVQRFFTRGVSATDIDFFSHGTTVATNALLEMKGATIGMLITKGFRAIQVVQSQARESNQFELKFQRPTMLASQQMTSEITGRIDYAGTEVEPLNEEDVREAARALQAKGATSFAVCYMFSFMNAAHEQRTAEIIRKEVPGAYVSLSSAVLPRIREWPRMSTTMLNAYLEPGLAYYASDLDSGLDTAGVETARRFLMQSNGGVMPLGATAGGGRTVQTLLSGPAAGVQATGYVLGEQQGWEQVVTMDMGGTSCDIAFIQDSKPLEVTEGTIAERRLDVPAFDISTISAGGGTIARLTAANFMSVGPDSAGADPGPVCYGNGGDRPTVTDADLICGFLNPGHLLGGETTLDREGALATVKNSIADSMGLSAEEAAAGIVRLINARMADEIRVQAAKKVIDLASFTLVPFGGAGPVHAAMVADELGIPRILVPPNPGAFSALGLLCSDIVHDYIRSDICEINQLEPDRAETYFTKLEEQAATDLVDEGLKDHDREFIRDLDLRYAGQGYEIRTPLDGLSASPMNTDGLAQVQERFHDLHQTLHGHSARDQEIEVVSYRVRVRVPVPKQDLPEINIPEGETEPAGTREVTFDGRETYTAPVYTRDTLKSSAIEGPAIVEQFDSTTVLPPGWTAKLDRFGNIVGERNA